MAKDNKTLIILSPGFPETEADTVCLPMQQALIKALTKTTPGLNIVVLAFQFPYVKKEYIWYGVKVKSFDGRNRGGLKRLLLRKKIYGELRKINSESKLAGILSFWCGECALVGKRFADKFQLKHFCWILGQDAKKENKYPQRIKPRADELVALSDFLQDEFEKNHGIQPAAVIPPGIDTKLYREPVTGRDIDILGAGSLIPLKQYNIFLEIVAEVKKQFPSLKAVLIGDGPEKQKLEKDIVSLQLQDTVTLTGELPHPEVLRMMQRAKVFLHPSKYEGFSGVCLEALYAGAHVISFTRAMNDDIEQWQVVRSKEEMYQRVIELLSDPALAHNQNLPFSIERTAASFLDKFGV
jgi:glycosyltransferase involved in cell wall biosynthesis